MLPLKLSVLENAFLNIVCHFILENNMISNSDQSKELLTV